MGRFVSFLCTLTLSNFSYSFVVIFDILAQYYTLLNCVKLCHYPIFSLIGVLSPSIIVYLNSHSSTVNCVVRHSILFGRMNSTVDRNVISCCKRYNTSLDCLINHTFSPDNIDRLACAVSEDKCSNVNMLSELIQCRDITFSLSFNMFDRDDIEQLFSLICTT